MAKKTKRFTPEFKAEAVRLIVEEGMPVAQVSSDLGVSDSALRKWIAQGEIDEGRGPEDVLTSSEKAELARLPRENRQLKMEGDILKKAAAFFAKESE